MMSRISPCLDCKERYVGCHATCAAYLDYAAERKEISIARQTSRIYNDYQNDLTVKINKKRRKRDDE